MRLLYAIRQGFATGEAQFFGSCLGWDISAGFFKGFGLGFTVQAGEWDFIIGCFSVGGTARDG